MFIRYRELFIVQIGKELLTERWESANRCLALIGDFSIQIEKLKIRFDYACIINNCL